MWRPVLRLDRNGNAIVRLRYRHDARGEIDARVGKNGEPFDRKLGKLVLFALHRVRVARIVFEHAEIEFGDKLAGRAFPIPKQRFDQTAADHLFDQVQALPAFPAWRRGWSRRAATR